MNGNIWIYILIMAAVTYLIRVLPLTLIRTEIRSPFLRSFLHYVPYVTLTAMVFPAVLTATSSFWSALAGFVVALVIALCGKNMFVVSFSACAAVFMVELAETYWL